MKRFYIAILLFLLPVFIFMGGTEYVVRHIPNEYKYKNDWMEQHVEEVETLILGNSHTQVGLNPVFMGDHTFNLSIAGQDYLYTHFLFFKYVKKLKHLKTLIIPVSYFSFYKDLHGDNSVTMQELYYRIYMGSPYHRYDITYNMESLYYKPLLGKLRNLYNSNYRWCPKGWSPWLKSDKSPIWNSCHVNKALARLNFAHSYIHVSENYRQLADIADYCNHHGIKFVLVSTPQTKEYNGCLNEKQIENTQKTIKKLQRQYVVEYYDFREDYRYKDDDFFDQSHLSEIGAEKFTKNLMSCIQRSSYCDLE